MKTFSPNRQPSELALRRQIPKRGETDLRGIEWRYLWHKCQGQQLKTVPHEAEVARAELSPDARWLATASGGSVWIWDTTREGERRVLGSGAPADAGFFSWPRVGKLGGVRDLPGKGKWRYGGFRGASFCAGGLR